MTKTYQTPSSELRLLLYKTLHSNGFNRFAYFCFLLIFLFRKKSQPCNIFAAPYV